MYVLVIVHYCAFSVSPMRQSQPSVYPLSSLTQLKTNQSICLLLSVPSWGNCFKGLFSMCVLKVNVPRVSQGEQLRYNMCTGCICFTFI